MRKRCPWVHNHAPWLPQEEDFLRVNRGRLSSAAMAAALPGRTRQAVQSRCSQLGIYKRDLSPPAPGISNRYWKASEVAVLRRHAKSGPAYIQQWHLPHRSQDAIGQAITRFGLRPMQHQRLPETHVHDFEQQVAA
jgi:hypothetical protein